jgi:hypothetical protein
MIFHLPMLQLLLILKKPPGGVDSGPGEYSDNIRNISFMFAVYPV